MDEYIKRDIDKVIEEWDKSGQKALMILGARQIGKTYSIEEFLKNKYTARTYEVLPEINLSTTKNAINYIAENRQIPPNISFIEDLFFRLNINFELLEGDVIFIDEIQMLSNDKKLIANEFIKTTLIRLLSGSPYKIIFSGSLLGSKINNIDKLDNDIPGLVIKRMYPISFIEFSNYLEGNNKLTQEMKKNIVNGDRLDIESHVKLLELFVDYSFVGGIPFSVLSYKGTKSVKDALISIDELRDDYYKDVNKYYLEEYGIDGNQNIFIDLLSGLPINDKKSFMNQKFKEEEKLRFYRYVLDSDIGILIKHIEELDKTIEEQKKPKTFFNDIGFLRLLVDTINVEARKTKQEPPRLYKKFYDVRDIDDFRNDIIDGINQGKSNITDVVGIYFEQVTAQELKAQGFDIAYLFNKKTNSQNEQELEFILSNSNHGIEVKAGSFQEHPSSIIFSKDNITYFMTMMPYVGYVQKNIVLLPIYAISFISEIEKVVDNLKIVSDDIKQKFSDGRLPESKGYE